MARVRVIKPGFFLNDALAECNPLARLLFAGLWCIADREGRLEDRPRRIKAELLPYDDCNVDELLDQLHKHGFIIRYEVDGEQYIQIVNFLRHQNPHYKEPDSTIPPPPDDCTMVAVPSTDSEHTSAQSTTTDKSNMGQSSVNGKASIAQSSNHDRPIINPTLPETSANDSATMEPTLTEPSRNDSATFPEESVNLERRSRSRSRSNNRSSIQTDRHDQAPVIDQGIRPQCGGGVSVCPSVRAPDFDVGDDDETDLQRVCQHYQRHIGAFGPTQVDRLRSWLKDPDRAMPAEVVMYAIDIATQAGKRRMNYVEGILRNWANDGLRSVEAIKKAEAREDYADTPRYDHAAYLKMLEEAGISYDDVVAG